MRLNVAFSFNNVLVVDPQILKKDFDNHKNDCASIELTCQDCQLVYKRGDADTKHTENICSKEQFDNFVMNQKETNVKYRNLLIN